MDLRIVLHLGIHMGWSDKLEFPKKIGNITAHFIIIKSRLAILVKAIIIVITNSPKKISTQLIG